MRHTTSQHLISVPIDIPKPMDDVFAGLALYNTGTLTVAYKVGVAFVLEAGIGDLMMHPLALAPGERLTINVRQMIGSGRDR